MNYRSVANLNEDIKKWIQNLPQDLDLVVGIPRSGLLVANLLSLYLNLPLTDVEGLLQRRIIQHGRTRVTRHGPGELDLSRMKKILIVDDSARTGNTINAVKSRLQNETRLNRIYYGAVYIAAKAYGNVDFWYEMIDTPRVFEWNLLHKQQFISNSCIDIDGVLCRDPTPKENDDGENYRQFISTVKPLILPSFEIGWLVTCRLEKYRSLTEKWLETNGVKYRNLIMMDLPDKETRVSTGNHALFKAEIYKKTGAFLFVESSLKQAVEITKYTGKPVLCFEKGSMITPDIVTKFYFATQGTFARLAKTPGKETIDILRKIKRRVLALKWKIMAIWRIKTGSKNDLL